MAHIGTTREDNFFYDYNTDLAPQVVIARVTEGGPVSKEVADIVVGKELVSFLGNDRHDNSLMPSLYRFVLA